MSVLELFYHVDDLFEQTLETLSRIFESGSVANFFRHTRGRRSTSTTLSAGCGKLNLLKLDIQLEPMIDLGCDRHQSVVYYRKSGGGQR